MATPKIPKPDPQAMYVCLENHTGPTGLYQEGDRLRGNHPDVMRVAAFWLPETTTTDERHQARFERFYHVAE